MHLTKHDIAGMIDLSAVRPDSDEAEVRALAGYAAEVGCVAVFAMPSFTALARELLSGFPQIAVGGAVGFPSGAPTTATKVAEARELVRLGCTELDMVINVGMLRSDRLDYVGEDIRAVIEAGGGVPVKVILECHYLSERQILAACDLCLEAGAAFVKTGTGWAPTGATLENIRLIHSRVGGRLGIKAAGGVRDLETLIQMYRGGVRRFGIGLHTARSIFGQIAALPGGVVELD